MNTMLTRLVCNNEFEKVLSIHNRFNSLQNDTSHVIALKVCKYINDFDRGKYIISNNIGNISNNNSIELLTMLMDFYRYFNDFNNALNIFDCILKTKINIETINAMMNVYCNNEMNAKCIELFNNIEKYYKLIPNLIATSLTTTVTPTTPTLNPNDTKLITIP